MSSPRRNRRSSVQQVKVLPPPITAATTEADIPSWVVQNLATKFQKDPDEISSLLLKDPTLVKTLLAGDPFNVSSSKQDDHDSSFTHKITTKTPTQVLPKSTSPIIKRRVEDPQFPDRYFRAPSIKKSLLDKTRDKTSNEKWEDLVHDIMGDENSDPGTSGESDNEPTTGENFHVPSDLLEFHRLHHVYKEACTKRGVTTSARVTFLLKSHARLIDISDYHLGSKGTAAFADTLMYAAENGQHDWIGSLHANGNDFGDEGAQVLASILPKSTALEHVNVDNNSMGHVGGEAFARAISRSRNLKSFSSSKNSRGFGSAFLQGLAASDIVLSRVKKVHLVDTGLTELDSSHLSTVVRLLRLQLTDFDLGWNCLRDRTFHVLMRALLNKKTKEQEEQEEEEEKQRQRERRRAARERDDGNDDDGGDESKGGNEEEAKREVLSDIESNENDAPSGESVSMTQVPDALVYSHIQRLSLNMCSLSDDAGVFMGEFLRLSKSID